ncbi:family 20 glycosylhydrolase [Halosquirtibacter xylanolyticus]|uniref:beta-N-acetylhexosaminidase n=1 Tax=Halosquirtibacter xylanolyticus TaxID=3374599 RepID=UPI003748BC4A|nr:family 20 glycosylhydrolase [Prolixibacteraceae bacterium]
MRKIILTLLVVILGIQTYAQGDIFPKPQQRTNLEGTFNGQQGRAYLCPNTTGMIFPTFKACVSLLEKKQSIAIDITKGLTPSETPILSARIDSMVVNKPQGYRLKVTKNTIEIIANNNEGLYSGLRTLKQILQNPQKMISCQRIIDWPDFERRGVMLDISRDKVPTMETLRLLVDRFADWKVNELQLYIEHTFAYKDHKEVWEHASPMTAEQIIELDAYCKERFIDLVPNQNSLGHMERWLKHDNYHYIAERPTGLESEYWMIDGRRLTLCAVDHRSIEFMDSLYAEYLPNFSSKFANIGGDEPYELGYGRSKEMCDKIGKSKVYLNYINKITDRVKQYGKKAQMWGDIVVKHPELIPLMPKDVICMVWGYRPNQTYVKECKRFHEEGIPFYVCPGTNGWLTYIGKTERARLNINNAVTQGKKYGAYGVLNTNWGDHGHMQPISTAFPALIYGAGVSWSVDQNKDTDIAKLINEHVYMDPTGNMGKALMILTNAYMGGSMRDQGGHPFCDMMSKPDEYFSADKKMRHYEYELIPKMREEIKKAQEIFKKAKPNTVDAEITLRELEIASKLADWGCQLTEARLVAKDKYVYNIPLKTRKHLVKELNKIIEEYEEVWVIRNRVGGLEDSSNRMREAARRLLEK